MSGVSQELFAAAMSLPIADRLELAESIIANSPPPAPELVGDSWIEELNRRSNEIDAGTAKMVPWAEVQRRAKLSLNGG